MADPKLPNTIKGRNQSDKDVKWSARKKNKKYLWDLIPPGGFPEVFLVTVNQGKKSA